MNTENGERIKEVNPTHWSEYFNLIVPLVGAEMDKVHVVGVQWRPGHCVVYADSYLAREKKKVFGGQAATDIAEAICEGLSISCHHIKSIDIHVEINELAFPEVVFVDDGNLVDSLRGVLTDGDAAAK